MKAEKKVKSKIVDRCNRILKLLTNHEELAFTKIAHLTNMHEYDCADTLKILEYNNKVKFRKEGRVTYWSLK